MLNETNNKKSTRHCNNYKQSTNCYIVIIYSIMVTRHFIFAKPYMCSRISVDKTRFTSLRVGDTGLNSSDIIKRVKKLPIQ